MRFIGAAAVLLSLGAAGPGLAAQEDAPAPALTLDPRSLALASEIIDISFPPESRHAMMARASETMLAQARTAASAAFGGTLDEDARRILDRFIDRVRALSNRMIADSTPAIFTAMARAYARTFTFAELVQIRAFVGTPAGTNFMQRSMDLLADPDVARANTAYMAATFQALEPLQAELMEELRVYLESHERHRSEPTSGTR